MAVASEDHVSVEVGHTYALSLDLTELTVLVRATDLTRDLPTETHGARSHNPLVKADWKHGTWMNPERIRGSHISRTYLWHTSAHNALRLVSSVTRNISTLSMHSTELGRIKNKWTCIFSAQVLLVQVGLWQVGLVHLCMVALSPCRGGNAFLYRTTPLRTMFI